MTQLAVCSKCCERWTPAPDKLPRKYPGLVGMGSEGKIGKQSRLGWGRLKISAVGGRSEPQPAEMMVRAAVDAGISGLSRR